MPDGGPSAGGSFPRPEGPTPEGLGGARVPPSPPPPLLPPSAAASDATVFALRAREARRAWRLWALAPLGLVGLTLLDSAVAFLAAVTVFQILAWPVYMRRRGKPARPGAAVLSVTPEGKAWLFGLWSLVLAALFVESSGVRLLVASVFATVAASAPVVRANVARVLCRRVVERRARAGSPSVVTWRLVNPTGKPALGLVVRDPLGHDATPAAVDVAFDAVPASGSATAATTIVFERRGWKRFRPALVTSRFPLGLFSVTYETPAPGETLVLPREGRATAALLARLRGASPQNGRAVAPRPGLDHFHGLREWREGDDPRRIHWRTTAKRGERTLMEWREEQTRRVTVVLGRGPGKGPEADRRFERAVSVAATVLRAAIRAKLPVRLVLGGEAGARGGPDAIDLTTRRRFDAALAALAVVKADERRKPEARLEGDAAGETTLVWVGSGDEPDVSRRLAAVKERHGSALHLRADDPALPRWVKGLP